MGSSPSAETFFEAYLAAPLILGLYFGWKIYARFSRDPSIHRPGWKLFVRTYEIDLVSGMRENVFVQNFDAEHRESFTQEPISVPKKVFNALF